MNARFKKEVWLQGHDTRIFRKKMDFWFGIINRELSCCFPSIEKRSDPKQKINDPGCDQQLAVLV